MASSIIILAAGRGTRMKSKKPKVMHEISGKPMLFHAIDAATSMSDDVIVVLYHEAETIRSAIEREYKGIRFHIQDAANFPGTGGALRGIEIANDRAIILNGDMPLVTKDSLLQLVDGASDIAMSIIELDNPLSYGRVVIIDGKVEKIVEKKDCNAEELEIKSVNAGVYGVTKDVLDKYIPMLSNDNSQNEYYLTDIVKMAKDDGLRIAPVYVQEEEYMGVNSKLDLSAAEEIMQKRIRDYWMTQGVSMRLVETIYIDSDAVFEGECMLENGVTILGDTKIIDSHIKSHSVIENAQIKDSTIGPMARIRPDTKLIETHIGNFVEIKKSTLNGVKAGHLSYIGDSQIDSGTNIGAGTITCNYDGVNKYKTIIGKDVFIGSDTQIIAPVTIEDNVIVAAGSTVTKDIKSGALAISRAPLKQIDNFFYKFFKKEK